MRRDEMPRCNDNLDWHGLYASSLKFSKFLDPATNSHPAKMSLLLADKILKHLEELNLIKPNDTIIDFMAGTCRTGVIAELSNHPFIGVELESHFIKMSEQNKKQLESRIQRKADWKIIQGDARQLSTLLKEKGVGIVSPPYGFGEGLGHSGNTTNKLLIEKNIHGSYTGIVSPPYGNIGLEKNGQGIDKHKQWETYRKQGGGSSYEKFIKQQERHSVGYIDIVSPPYSKAEDGGGIFKKGYIKQDEKYTKNMDTVGERTYSSKMHNFSTKNIGNLPDKGSLVGLTSPPYENNEGGGKINESKMLKNWNNKGGKAFLSKTYGKTEGQIGNLAAITSPPYADQEGTLHHSKFKDPKEFARIASERFKSGQKKGHFASAEAIQRGMEKSMLGYEGSKQNIGNLPDKGSLVGLTSPPYFQRGSDINKNDDTINRNNRGFARNIYGSSPAQIGNLAAITSPPKKKEEIEYCSCDD